MFCHSTKWLGWRDLNPRDAGVKVLCLTAWLQPSKKGGYKTPPKPNSSFTSSYCSLVIAIISFWWGRINHLFFGPLSLSTKKPIKRLSAYISPIFVRQNHLNISQAYKSATFFKLIKISKSKIIGLAVQLPSYWVCNCQSSDAPMGKTNLLRIYFLTSSFVPRTVLLLS